MATLYVDTLEPQSGTALTIGEAGQNTVLAGNDLRANVLQDAGGNAIFTSNGSGTLSGVNSDFGSAWVLLSTTVISASSASVDITANIDSTYKEYIFKFYGITVSTADKSFQVQFNSSGGSGFDEDVTNAYYQAQHDEDDGYNAFNYVSGASTSGTGYHTLFYGLGVADAHECANGTLHLINPSSTTYSKLYWSRFSNVQAGNSDDPGAHDNENGGIIDTTSAIDEISFKQSSGTIDSGTIKLFGIK